jgi:hypothetical protein
MYSSLNNYSNLEILFKFKLNNNQELKNISKIQKTQLQFNK